MNRVTIQACPLCGGTELERALTCVDHYASGEAFDLCRCRTCGFLFTQDFPSEAEIGRYYDSPDYISHSDTRKGLMNAAYHWARSCMLGRKARLVKEASHRQQGRLLDIGTGTGYFAHAMAGRGWQVDAVETNAGARAFAKEHFGLDVWPDMAAAAKKVEGYDVITLWHVMEHLERLDETWELLRRCLAPRGVLVAATPNAASADARHYGAQWAAYDVPRHLWHFTPATMQRMGAKHGFVLAGRYPMPLDAFYVSILTEKQMGRRWAFARGLWAGALAWLEAWPAKDRSSSLIYVFRKGQEREAEGGRQ